MAGIDKLLKEYGKDWAGLLTTPVRRSEGIPIPEMKLMNPFQSQFQQGLTQCQLNRGYYTVARRYEFYVLATRT